MQIFLTEILREWIALHRWWASLSGSEEGFWNPRLSTDSQTSNAAWWFSGSPKVERPFVCWYVQANSWPDCQYPSMESRHVATVAEAFHMSSGWNHRTWDHPVTISVIMGTRNDNNHKEYMGLKTRSIGSNQATLPPLSKRDPSW